MDLRDEHLDAVIALVRQHTGIAMNENKRVLLQGRLLPRMRALGLASYDDYIAHLRRGGPEVGPFIDSVTTNDSAFFRTPAVWWYLNDEFLADWHAGHGGAPLRIWSAAAATGEEAYSMAMLCLEFQRQHPDFRFTISATDISSQALDAARGATYRGRTVERFALTRPALFRRYLAGGPERWTVAPEVRAHVAFATHNLLAPPPRREHFDLVLLRNVLIYFDEQNQERILAQVRTAMRPGARLVLGEQESITRIRTPFEFEQAHVYRIAGEPQ
ncbi:protein-glutamate O-methyltransferase CheR [uncultured Massilia sp.]|uniref:CheR family methyltransferase n=1 Tax=uncultured Massilia sp. TaxID=169973 RepID=UPI0025F993D2|nr:protein-glutamate O-methyltransferase CheR [uncultured Massilia sp.]